MKSKAGFTLIHMLAAITVIALTASGVAQAIFTLSRMQQRAAATLVETEQSRDLQFAFAETLSGIEDFSQLSGGAGNFATPCPGGMCEADVISAGGEFQLALHRPGQEAIFIPLPARIRFEYYSPSGVSELWPGVRYWENLTAIAIVAGDSDSPRPLAQIQVRAKQPRDCEYDSVIRDCRGINR